MKTKKAMKNRPNGIVKTTNDYSDTLSRSVFERTPKAVFAAIAVSLMANDRNVPFDQIDAAILEEWAVLNRNGIVPQKAIKTT